ncbi:putative transporter C38C10.2 [Toxocara canis]|uniref:Putative transporter C38C10.2 n=1 Tax=Toxocara canis TaxID=6265 RepID=A0A0B2VLZ3_TOXCA|nr:putative transporter C38C10.2 [Toxocara canis]
MISDQPIKDVVNVGCFAHRTRYFILILGSLCISLISSNMITYNFTKICMVYDNETDTLPLKYPLASADGITYTQFENSALMWAVGVGTLIAAWPFQIFYEMFGARLVFFIAGMLSTVATAIIPYLAQKTFNGFIFARFVQGLSFGADFAAIGLLTVRWASLKQHGLFVGLLTSFSQISVIITMPLSGELCESSFGWPSVYYIHALLSAFFFLMWFICYRDDPSLHPTVTDVELEKIRRGKSEAEQKVHIKTPYKKILLHPIMWSVWLSAMGELMTSQFIVMYGPTYLKEVLGFGVAHTGYFVALPRALHFFFKVASGIASDKIKFLSERVKMIIANTIALMVSGILFLGLGFLSRDVAYYALGLLMAIELTTGFVCAGFYKCATLVARQYSHFVLSQIQFIKCLSLFVEPALVAIFIRNNKLTEWRTVFIIHAVTLIIGNIVFCMVATDKPASFTQEEEKNLKDVKTTVY